MTDKPNPVPPRQPLVLPPNFRDVTAERIGTVVAIVGATAAGKDKPEGLTRPHLVQEGLATATPERPIEVVRVRITDAGRLTLAG
jgi:hypothetical protein